MLQDLGTGDDPAGLAEEQLEQEEKRFARTLNAGTDVASRELDRIKRGGGTVVPGHVAFDLYQSRGIPVELIEEFAQEEGLELDRDGFDEALKAEQERGQASWKGDLSSRFCSDYTELADAGIATEFDGYGKLELTARVIALLGTDGPEDELRAGDEGEVVLDVTPFYAESGGQVGDTGDLTWDGGHAFVLDTQKPLEGLIVHRVEVEEGTLRVNREVTATVTAGPRLDTQRNHTATHLLHAALREVLGEAAQQAGSLVEPDEYWMKATSRGEASWTAPRSPGVTCP